MRKSLAIVAFLLAGCSTGMLTGGDYYEKQPRTEGVAASDATVTNKVRRRMVDDPALSHYTIGVATYKGIVTLTGSVADFRERNRAEEIAGEVSGARSINNQIVVDDGSDPK